MSRSEDHALWAALQAHGDAPLPGETDDTDIVAGALAGLRAPTFLVDSASAPLPVASRGASRTAVVTLVAVVALASAAAIVLIVGAPSLRLGRDDGRDRGSMLPAISEDTGGLHEASEREPAPRRRPGAHASEDVVDTPAPEQTAPAPEPPVVHDETDAAATHAVAALPRTADALLSHAQTLMREGRTTAAMRAYKRLVERFPDSREAKAALVSMGRIALRGGDAKQALAHFDAYLAASAGALVEEARYGRIRALRKLGRTTQELHSITAFLADHGDSIYAPRLRKRAEELRAE